MLPGSLFAMTWANTSECSGNDLKLMPLRVSVAGSSRANSRRIAATQSATKTDASFTAWPICGRTGASYSQLNHPVSRSRSVVAKAEKSGFDSLHGPVRLPAIEEPYRESSANGFIKSAHQLPRTAPSATDPTSPPTRTNQLRGSSLLLIPWPSAHRSSPRRPLGPCATTKDPPPTSHLPQSSPDHRFCNFEASFQCPHAVHPCPSVDSGLGLRTLWRT